jgi:hypothetical protein
MHGATAAACRPAAAAAALRAGCRRMHHLDGLPCNFGCHPQAATRFCGIKAAGARCNGGGGAAIQLRQALPGCHQCVVPLLLWRWCGCCCGSAAAGSAKASAQKAAACCWQAGDCWRRHAVMHGSRHASRSSQLCSRARPSRRTRVGGEHWRSACRLQAALRPEVQPCRTLTSQAACCCDRSASEAKPWRQERGRRVEAGAGVGRSSLQARSPHQAVISAFSDRQARGGQRGRPPVQLALAALGGALGGCGRTSATPQHEEAAMAMRHLTFGPTPRAATAAAWHP